MSNHHKITIKHKQGEAPLIGKNIEVFLDEKPLLGVVALSFEVTTGEFARVNLTLSAGFDIEAHILRPGFTTDMKKSEGK